MKKKFLAFTAAMILGTSTAATAKVDMCIFDLLGKSGESFNLMQEWSLSAKTWNVSLNLIPYQDEEQAQKDFDSGKCDGVYMTSMRARRYNKFAGSIDAIGAVRSNAIARKAISYVLDKRNQKRLISEVDGQKYEVAGIVQVGLAYIFVRDKKINSLDKAKGLKFAILHYDEAQKIVVESFGAIPVASDISDFVKKFNSGQVDAIAAPAYAYQPLEIAKGLGSNGGMFSFPVVNITGDLIIRSEKFPSNFGVLSREWFVRQLPKNFEMVNRLEEGVPNRYKMQFSQQDLMQFQRKLRTGRIGLTKKGIYDSSMMSVLKRARCTVERTNFECTLSDE